MEFVLIMQTRTGERRLKFGDAYKVKAGDAGFKAELNGAPAAAGGDRRGVRLRPDGYRRVTTR